MPMVYLKDYIVKGDSNFFFKGVQVYLLEAGHTINDIDESGFTFLHYAAQHGQHKIIDFLLRHKADVHARTKKGETPFMLAAENGYVPIMELLRNKGAQINNRDRMGSTALMKAVCHKRKYPVLFLLQNGVYLNEQDKTGNTAMSYAAASGQHEFVKLLIESGADTTKALQCKSDHFVGIDFIQEIHRQFKQACKEAINMGFDLGFNTSLKAKCIVIIKDYLFEAHETELRNRFVKKRNQGRRDRLALLFSPIVTPIYEPLPCATPRSIVPLSPPSPSKEAELDNIVDGFGSCSIS